MEGFFSKYGEVEKVKVLINKSGIATGDMVLQVTLTRTILGKSQSASKSGCWWYSRDGDSTFSRVGP